MHSLNLGYVLWAAGGCIESLLEFGIWGGADVSYDLKLKRAWHEFAKWAKQRKIPQLDFFFVHLTIPTLRATPLKLP